jgi:hypothetical protein
MNEDISAGTNPPERSHRQSTDSPIVDAVPADDEIDEQIRAEHHSIPGEIREQVRERDICCQVDGCRAPETDDEPGLLVQRIADDPTRCHRDDPDNLVTRCLRCARWIAQMPIRDDLPSDIQNRLGDADIDSTRVEILEYLQRSGPARTGEITDHVSLSTGVSVRRALYELMSLDVRNSTVDGQLVAKDRVTGEYGLYWQVPDDRDARGVMPLQPESRRDRILDSIVERLFDELENRVEQPKEVISDVVDRDPSQTSHMRRRAQAFQFPFERWADTTRQRDSAAAAVEAVSVVAGATDSVSRRLVAQSLGEMLERNDERDLAAILEQYAVATNPPQSVGNSETDESARAPKHDEAISSDHVALQVFDDDPGADTASLHSVTEDNDV